MTYSREKAYINDMEGKEDLASIEGLLIDLLQRAFGSNLLGLLLFGSRARGDCRDESDYDFLLILKDYIEGDPMKTFFEAYRNLRALREETNRDTTVLTISIEDLAKSLSSSVILNALIEGKIIYDREGVLKKIKEKVNDKLNNLGITRIKESWGYSWIVPLNLVPFKIEININDPPEYEYWLKLAEEHLEEAIKALDGGALVAAAYEAQLSIENSAKAVIGLFKPPTWIHNPAPELRQIIKQHGDLLKKVRSLEAKLNTLATLTDEAAPHHALASYGDVRRMVTPKEIYKPEEVRELVKRAQDAINIAREAVKELGELKNAH